MFTVSPLQRLWASYCTLNALRLVTSSAPVVTTRLKGPGAAVGLTDNLTVSDMAVCTFTLDPVHAQPPGMPSPYKRSHRMFTVLPLSPERVWASLESAHRFPDHRSFPTMLPQSNGLVHGECVGLCRFFGSGGHHEAERLEGGGGAHRQLNG